MNAHVIENGVVTNTIVVESLSDLPNLIEAKEGSIGWKWDGSTLTDPNAPSAEEIKTQKAASERNERNGLLSETDWMASSDVTMSDEWKTYRQALRDVPSQSGFPETITWPTKPS